MKTLVEDNRVEKKEKIPRQFKDKNKRDEEAVSKIKEKLSELKILLKVVSYLGIKAEDERGREAIISAVENVKSGELKKTEDSLEESCKFLREKIDETIEEELEKLRIHLASRNDYTEHENIGRSISKLKKAKEDKRYEDIPDLYFEAWDKVKRKEGGPKSKN